MNTTEKWLQLAKTFHGLCTIIDGGYDVRTPDDLDEFVYAEHDKGDGVMEAAQFVLHLFDSAPSRWKCGDFHLRRALESWDDAHIIAFQAWAVGVDSTHRPRVF